MLLFSHLVLSLCDSMDYIAHGILQARILEWVVLSFSRSSQTGGQTHVSCNGRRVLYPGAAREAQ